MIALQLFASPCRSFQILGERHRGHTRIVAVLALICFLQTRAWSESPASSAGTARVGNWGTGTNTLRSFFAQGVVQDLSAADMKVVIKHQAIAGFMPAMTMEFSVHDPTELRALRIGDAVTFTVNANDEQSWIEGIRKTSSATLAIPPVTKPGPDLAHIGSLKPGALFPDAELLDEHGKRIRFSDFRGRALAFTFIFTRCPLPEFCPRMSRRFAEARDLLVQRSPAVTNWQLLSISFDPEFDQSEVLQGYALNYRGTNTDRWLFAAASTNVTAALGSQIDFRLAREEGSFIHNLRTVVLDCSGRIYRQFDGNYWQAEDLAAALREAAARTETSPEAVNPVSVSSVRSANRN